MVELFLFGSWTFVVVVPFVLFFTELGAVGHPFTGAGVGQLSGLVAAFAFALVVGYEVPVL